MINSTENVKSDRVVIRIGSMNSMDSRLPETVDPNGPASYRVSSPLEIGEIVRSHKKVIYTVAQIAFPSDVSVDGQIEIDCHPDEEEEVVREMGKEVKIHGKSIPLHVYANKGFVDKKDIKKVVCTCVDRRLPHFEPCSTLGRGMVREAGSLLDLHPRVMAIDGNSSKDYWAKVIAKFHRKDWKIDEIHFHVGAEQGLGCGGVNKVKDLAKITGVDDLIKMMFEVREKCQDLNLLAVNDCPLILEALNTKVVDRYYLDRNGEMERAARAGLYL